MGGGGGRRWGWCQPISGVVVVGVISWEVVRRVTNDVGGVVGVVMMVVVELVEKVITSDVVIMCVSVGLMKIVGTWEQAAAAS